jgi:hypothetical protein
MDHQKQAGPCRRPQGVEKTDMLGEDWGKLVHVFVGLCACVNSGIQACGCRGVYVGNGLNV